MPRNLTEAGNYLWLKQIIQWKLTLTRRQLVQLEATAPLAAQQLMEDLWGGKNGFSVRAMGRGDRSKG